MTQSTYFDLNLVEGSDIVNPLVVDKPNYQAIDAQMYSNQNAGIQLATELTSGTIHAITRIITSASVFRWVATSDYNYGDTFTIDGTPVSASTPDGRALSDKCYVVNSSVIGCLVGTKLTIFVAPTVNIAEDITIDDTELDLDSDNVQGALEKIREMIYPVGSIYISSNSTNPSNIFGGTWTQIKDKFLLAAGDTHAAGSTGGSETHTPSGTVGNHTLTVAEMPSHTHVIPNVSTQNYNAGGSAYGFASDGARGTSSNATGGGQGHSHPFTGTEQNTMPPYLTVYMWQRTA